MEVKRGNVHMNEAVVMYGDVVIRCSNKKEAITHVNEHQKEILEAGGCYEILLSFKKAKLVSQTKIVEE